MPIGTGLTGWVAAHGKTIRIGDTGIDPRSLDLAPDERTESALLVPMTYERTVHGVLVVSKDGGDRFDADDETTLNIFAGYATHALLNATNMERLRRQQVELEHQLEGQRRLLDVNERLLSTLEPAGVLDLIADSLKAIVPYDTMTIYRIDRAAGVRRAVVARDRFADLIMAYEGPLKGGISGWVIEHSEAVLANEAHLDPRSVQVPGTPFEPEAMIVVPLLVNGDAIGTLNIGRMGGREAYFSANEFELTQLFAGQASIALQNAEVLGAVRDRAEHDALDRPAQSRLVPARARPGRGQRRRRAPDLDPDARPRRVQGLQRRLRPSRRRRPAGGDGQDPGRAPPATGIGSIATAATSSRRSCRARTARPPTRSPSGSGKASPSSPMRPPDRASRSASGWPATRRTDGPRTSWSAWPTAPCT